MALPNLEDYFLPGDPGAAIELLSRYGDDAMIVAGGTFVHGLEARGLMSEIKALIDLSKLDLVGVENSGGIVRIGARTNFAALMNHDIARQPALSAIADALRYPPAQIRNAGTIGGCVCAAAPLYDLPAALLALDGNVIAVGGNGSRNIPLGDFFTGLFENALEQDEFVSAIEIPSPAPKTASAFLKLETNANDLAIVNVAVRITLQDDEQVSDARIIVGGGVGETYARSRAAETALNGVALDADAIGAAAAAIGSDVQTISDHRGSAAYRLHIAKIFTQRALEKAAARLSGERA